MTAPIRFLPVAAVVLVLAGSACKKSSQPAPSGDVGMATAEEVKISTVQLGSRIGSDKRVAAEDTEFSPRDTIYASVVTTGSAPSATVTARWTYEDGQLVKEDSRTIAPSSMEATEFHISKPSGWPKGKYQVTLSVGNSSETKDFEVK
jgi:hypothetical protein